MARSEADGDFKLPLRPWLEKQINSGKYKGLEWEVLDGETKLFRLPWVNKQLPDWRDYYQIFRAWADHRGRDDADGEDYSKMKANFRVTLNKSADFEELTNLSQLHLQCGNYKVYRFVPPSEVRERMKNRNDAKATNRRNLNDNQRKTIEKQGLHRLDSLGVDSSSCRPTGANKSIDTLAIISVAPVKVAAPQHIAPRQNDIVREKIATVPPPSDLGEFSAVLALSPFGAVDDLIRQSGRQVEDVTVASGSSLDSESQYCMDTMLTQLQSAAFQKERMCECQVIISYNGEKVLDEYVTDMHRGCRIFYGDRDEQLRILQWRMSEEMLADFQLREIRLPTSLSNTMEAILDKTDLGIVIRYNPATYQLSAKRLCQNHVYFFDPHEESESPQPRKLERGEIVEIYSHLAYFMKFFDDAVNKGKLVPEAEIVLAIGTKPKSKVLLPAMKGLKIEIIPYAMKFIMGDDYGSRMSLYFSNPTNAESLLRSIKEVHYPSIEEFRGSYL